MFGAIALLAVLAAILVAVLIDDASHGQAVQVRHIVEVFAHLPTAGGLAVTVLGLASLFTTYTMITPILRDQFHASAQSISLPCSSMAWPAKPATSGATLALHWSSMRSVKFALILLVLGFATLFGRPAAIMALLALPWRWPSTCYCPRSSAASSNYGPICAAWCWP
jgi:predicted MFS family arabinose efflux permease